VIEDRHCTYNVTMGRTRVTIVAVEISRPTAYSEFVFVDLRTQHAMRTRHILICGLPVSTIFFAHYHDFRKKKITE
jgi:hypothetical protein